MLDDLAYSGVSELSQKFIIYTDVTGYGIGAVLTKMQTQAFLDPSETNEANSAEPGNREVIIAYISKNLKRT